MNYCDLKPEHAIYVSIYENHPVQEISLSTRPVCKSDIFSTLPIRDNVLM